MSSSSSITVRAVCRVHQLIEAPGRVGVSAIDKRPVFGSVAVHRLGVHGDVQADREHHGGEWKAVYLLSDEDVAPWAEELGRRVEPGFFGENLRLSGACTSEWEIGTKLAIGTVELEIALPRVPCRTFAERVGRPRWVSRFTETGKPGAYARVLRTGTLAAGDTVRLVSVPGHQVSVARVLAGVTAQEAIRVLGSLERSNLAPSLLRTLESVSTTRSAAEGPPAGSN